MSTSISKGKSGPPSVETVPVDPRVLSGIFVLLAIAVLAGYALCIGIGVYDALSKVALSESRAERSGMKYIGTAVVGVVNAIGAAALGVTLPETSIMRNGAKPGLLREASLRIGNVISTKKVPGSPRSSDSDKTVTIMGSLYLIVFVVALIGSIVAWATRQDYVGELVKNAALIGVGVIPAAVVAWLNRSS